MTEDKLSRRSMVTAVALSGAAVATGIMLVEYTNDYTVADASAPGDYIVEAGASEADVLGHLIPDAGDLHLSCWVSDAAQEQHPNGFVTAIAPDGELHERRTLSNPTPSEVLRSEWLYRVKTANTVGKHVIQLSTAEGEPIETATVVIEHA